MKEPESFPELDYYSFDIGSTVCLDGHFDRTDLEWLIEHFYWLEKNKWDCYKQL